jgi:hypothetical protein
MPQMRGLPMIAVGLTLAGSGSFAPSLFLKPQRRRLHNEAGDVVREIDDLLARNPSNLNDVFAVLNRYFPSRVQGCTAEMALHNSAKIVKAESSSNPMMKGLGADSEEKHEPVSDIDTVVVVDSLKALDTKRPRRHRESEVTARHPRVAINQLAPRSLNACQRHAASAWKGTSTRPKGSPNTKAPQSRGDTSGKLARITDRRY